MRTRHAIQTTVAAAACLLGANAARAEQPATAVAATAAQPSSGDAATVQEPPGPAAQPPAPGGEDASPVSGERLSLGKTLSVFGAVGYSYGFAAALGVGARFQVSLVPRGFLRLPHGMHDELGIEPGFDYFHAGYSSGAGAYKVDWDYDELTPLVGVVWNFWLLDKLAVYPKIDIGYRIGFWSESVNGQSVGGVAHADLLPLYFQGALGAAYRVGPVALRAEVGWEALRVGVGITL